MTAEGGPRPDEGRLPTFLIIGAPKAGTTSLAAHLSDHPDVFMSAEKELHFFTRQWGKGLGWYRRWFADAGAAKAIGEATPTYLYQQRALERIRTVLPEVKLLAILRDPIDRAYSAYWWMRETAEKRSFEEAVRAELNDPSSIPNAMRYLSAGRYLGYLERIGDYFPRERLQVVILERMRADPGGVFAEVCRFLGVDPAVRPPALGSVINPAYRLRWPGMRRAMMRTRAWRRMPRLAGTLDRLNRKTLRYPAMDPALRSQLAELYREENARLGAWLAKDLSEIWS